MPLPNPIEAPFPIDFVQIPTTNFRVGRPGVPDMIVIHIVEGSKQSCIGTFKDPSVQKSAHFLTGKDGSITQFVSTGNTAYANGIVHNPVSELVLARLPKNPNDYTISIENEGFSTADVTDAQYSTLIKLVSFLSKKWNIPLDSTHVIRHREIEALKSCPGLVNVEKILQGARAMA